ncbi:hypothetical protein BO70DRAFT_393877 [Aspergillus heteromorphus CBS 117.55]|uniref:fatty-acyl-CoA synthase system n=1 Tax=Aspergillus heteromorphus CBS 117.55 TaxID=1448321 RepID=A0A317WNV2_9EURO|nr:uncharacterized protein BO70DRAFT_393877 [Aspergillus heteromorphus CBS 117.55]PWY88154.1 hypothetical protein BO70DRAFT_393877 [Aspergillus heteromorphus CBS 117.55]
MIPLQGIDVPFHSAHLRPGVASDRNSLEERIPQTEVDPVRLVGNWISNVMGTPFELSREYILGDGRVLWGCACRYTSVTDIQNA